MVAIDRECPCGPERSQTDMPVAANFVIEEATVYTFCMFAEEADSVTECVVVVPFLRCVALFDDCVCSS